MNESQIDKDNNNNNIDEKKARENCLLCNITDCFQLDSYDEDNPDIGRELHFGELLFKKIHYEENHDLADIVCKNNHFLQSICFFVNAISETEDNVILIENLLQSTRDLKTSIFLAITGNYRNAMQVLRCSYETLLFCLYYMLDLKQAEDEEEIKEIKKSYNN